MGECLQTGIADAKADGWDWIAAECRRVLDEIAAARETAGDSSA